MSWLVLTRVVCQGVIPAVCRLLPFEMLCFHIAGAVAGVHVAAVVGVGHALGRLYRIHIVACADAAAVGDQVKLLHHLRIHLVDHVCVCLREDVSECACICLYLWYVGMWVRVYV